MRRLIATRMCRPADDAGFTLIEIVVAMAIFAVFASMSLGLLVRAGDVTRGNLQRTAAANLATEQIQVARSMSATAIPDGITTRTQTVKSTAFTITQTTTYLAADSANSVCDGTSTALAYKLVTVKVTWPEMGSIQPVRQDTLKAVGVGSDGLGSTGAVALQVTGNGGLPINNMAVSLSDGSTTVTDVNGCAVFTGVHPGTYTATLNTPGYVGLANAQLTTKASIGVTAGLLTRTGVSYDTTRSIVVTAGSPVSGAVIPSGLPLILSNSYLGAETAYPPCPATGTASSACATGPTATASGAAGELYPFIYTVKLGTCTETSASSLQTDLSSAASDGSTVSVPMGAITVNILTGLGVYSGTKTITIKHISGNAGCPAQETYTVTAPSGAKILVPYGSWNVSVPLNSSGAAAVSTLTPLTLTAASRTASTTLTVVS